MAITLSTGVMRWIYDVAEDVFYSIRRAWDGDRNLATLLSELKGGIRTIIEETREGHGSERDSIRQRRIRDLKEDFKTRKPWWRDEFEKVY